MSKNKSTSSGAAFPNRVPKPTSLAPGDVTQAATRLASLVVAHPNELICLNHTLRQRLGDKVDKVIPLLPTSLKTALKPNVTIAWAAASSIFCCATTSRLCV
jgi:hypothetical protein